MRKRLLSFVLAVLMIASLLPATALAADVVKSGTCGAEGDGSNLTWTLDSEGLLTISGTGRMRDYKGNGNVPWCDYSYNVKSVLILSGVTYIGDFAFSVLNHLMSVVISDSVASIGHQCFFSCDSLTGIWVNEGNIYYSNSADGVLFNKDKTTLIQCPGAFKAYTIPDSVTSIGEDAFASCESLTSVIIPDSVTSIGRYAFDACDSLTSVMIPDSVTSIGKDAFLFCDSLTGIWVSEGNNDYSSDASGVLFNKAKTTLIRCPGTFKAYAIPDSVTSIGADAFEGCSSLTRVTIPSSVTSIGERAFEDCSSLTSVTIPSSVISIGIRAFNSCSSLTSVTIPDSVTSIGSSAFEDCTSLTDVYYAGSEAQWKAISISSYGNDDLLNANIHYYSVDPGAYSSIYGADAQERALTVYGNKNDSATIETNYQALPGVEASGGADKRTTGKDGKVTLQNDGSSVTFHKDGYVDRTLSAAALNVSADVYLQKTSDYPVINAVWLNDVNDVMNTRYPMNLVQSKRYKVEAEISWGSSSAKRVILYQGDKSYDITAGASSLVLSDRFDLSKDLYIAATDQKNIRRSKN